MMIVMRKEMLPDTRRHSIEHGLFPFSWSTNWLGKWRTNALREKKRRPRIAGDKGGRLLFPLSASHTS
jgi:hypothetical protein